MSGFANSIIGGATKLIRAAIQSPNYLAGISGWSINKNGSAEFNNVTVRGTIVGGTFNGTDFILNSSGFFIYSGTPAAGNLAIAVAPVSGTDGFGNTYIGGLDLFGGTSQTPGAGAINFPITGVGNLAASYLFAYITNSGLASEFGTMQFAGPKENAFPDQVAIDMFSSSKGGPVAAQGQLNYIDSVGAFHTQILWTSGSVVIAPPLHLSGTLFGAGGTLTVGDSLLFSGDGNCFKPANTSYPSGASSTDADLSSIVNLKVGTYEIKAVVFVQSAANTTGLSCIFQTNGTAGQNKFVVGCNRVNPTNTFQTQVFSGDGVTPQTFTIGTPSNATYSGIFEGTIVVTAAPAQLGFAFGPIGGTTPTNVLRGSYMVARRIL